MQKGFFITAKVISLILSIFTAVLIFIDVNSVKQVNADNVSYLQTVNLDFSQQADLSALSLTNAQVSDGKLSIQTGGKVETKAQTEFFSLLIKNVKADKLNISFGSGAVTVDTANNKILFTVNGTETYVLIDRKIDFSEYSVYLELNNGEYKDEIINDSHVVTKLDGGINVGIAGASDALMRVYDTVASETVVGFSYGVITVSNIGSSMAQMEGLKIFPIDTNYDIETRNYDPADDTIEYKKKPVKLTDKQRRERNIPIIIGCVCGGLLLAGGVFTIVIILRKRGKKHEN